MALIICPTHGESEVAFASKALVAAVLAGAIPPEPIRAVHLEIDSGLPSRHWVDSAFAAHLEAKFGLTADPLVVPPGEASFDVLCDLAPVCRSCMQDWLPLVTASISKV